MNRYRLATLCRMKSGAQFILVSTWIVLGVSYLPLIGQSPSSILKKANTYYNDVSTRDSSILFMEKAISIYSSQEKYDTIMEAAFSKGQYLLTERGFQNAIDWLHSIQKQYKDKLPPEHGHWLYLYYQFANAFSVGFKLDSATYYLSLSDQIISASKVPNKIEARIYNLDAWIASMNREYARGILSAKKAFRASQLAYPDRPAVANASIYTIAVLHHYSSNQDSALHYARINASNNREIYGQESTQLGSSYNLLGSIYKEKYDHEFALRYFKKAEQIYFKDYQRTGQFGSLLLVQGNIGLIYFENKEYDLAEQYCSSALKYEEELYGEDNEALVYNLSRLAQIYSAFGDHGKAFRYAERMVAIQKAQSSSSLVSLAQYQNILGTIYNNGGDFERARLTLAEAIKNYEESGEEATNRSILPVFELGKTYAGLDDVRAAQALFNSALEEHREVHGSKHPSLASIFNELSKIFISSEPADASEYLDSAMYNLSQNPTGNFVEDLQRAEWSPIISNLVESKLALLKNNNLSTEDRIIEIVEAYDAQLEAYLPFIRTETRLQDLQSANERIYDYLIEALVAQGNIESALQYNERTRSLAIRLATNGSELIEFSHVPEEILAEDRKLRVAVKQEMSRKFAKQEVGQSDFEVSSNSALETYQAYKQTIKENYPIFYEGKYGLQFPNLEKIQSRLTKDQIILSYRYLHNSLIAFIIQSDDIDYFEYSITPSDSSIIELLQATTARKNISSVSKRVYQYLIDPIDSIISGKQLFIIPDGILHYLSFEMLLDEDNKYLNSKVSVSYGLAIDLVFSEKKSRKRNLALSAFAPGFMTSEDDSGGTIMKFHQNDSSGMYVSALPQSVDFVEERASKYASHWFTRSEATEEAFYRASVDSDIILLATHGMINDDQPMMSKLLFSKSTDSTATEDGFLHTYEIYANEIPASLAILTACNTGIGQLRSGEGMLSLSHAFSHSGCPSIVSTKWSVDESASIEIVDYFIRNLKDGMTKPEALREAKINFIENNPEELHHPYYWAGITLLGDPEIVVGSSHLIYYFVPIFGLLLIIIFSYRIFSG